MMKWVGLKYAYSPKNVIFLVCSSLIFQVPHLAFAQKLPKIKLDSSYVKQLLDSGAVLEGVNPKAALKIYAEAQQVSQKINYPLGLAKALHYSGIVYSDRSNYPAALVHYKKALQLYRKINYNRGIGACYTNMGNLYRYQSKFDSALVNYQFSIEFFKNTANGMLYHWHAGMPEVYLCKCSNPIKQITILWNRFSLPNNPVILRW